MGNEKALVAHLFIGVVGFIEMFTLLLFGVE